MLLDSIWQIAFTAKGSLKQNRILGALAVGVLVFSGCNSSSDGTVSSTALAPLTDAQKQVALSTLQSSITSASAAQFLNPSLTSAAAGADSASGKYSRLTAILKSDTHSGVCQVQSTQQSFKITGSACPINYDDESPVLSQSSPFSIQYKVNDPVYGAVTEISSITLNGNLTTLQTAATNTLQFMMRATGSIQLAQVGTLPFSLNESAIFTGQTATSAGTETYQSTTRVQFPQFTAELTVTGALLAGQLVKSYYINGAQLSETDANTYINPSFTQTQGGGSLLGRSSFNIQ